MPAEGGEGLPNEQYSDRGCNAHPIKGPIEPYPAGPTSVIVPETSPLDASKTGVMGDQGEAGEDAFVAPDSQVAMREIRRRVFVIGSAAFITTIAQMEVLGQLPIRYLLKQHLHVTPEQMSLFLLISAAAWYLKPLAGLASDSFPIFGTRRRHYLILSSVGAGVSWIVLALAPRLYLPVLITAVLLNAMMVMASTVMGGLLVEEAQRIGATGRFSSLREGMNMIAITIGLPVGGYLAERSFGWTAVLAAGLLFALAVIVFFNLSEEPLGGRESRVWNKSLSQLRVMYHSRTLWAAGVLLFLFYVTPGLATPLYYRQIDTLQFSQTFIGWLAVMSGLTGMVGAFIYARICKRFTLGYLLAAGIALSALTTLLYARYDSRESALVIVAISGLFGTLGAIPLYDLATRATPAGCEGLGFALMMSVRNFAVNGADWIGSWLMHSHQWSFTGLVYINAVTTLLVLVALPFLPRVLLNRSEDDGR